MNKLSSFILYFSEKLFKNAKIIENLKYGPDSLQRYDEYPVDSNNAPLLLFWYGGGWISGRKEIYHVIGYKLQAWGVHTFIIDYPKFPKRVYPGFSDDALTAINKIIKEYPNRKIILMGHSAGANTVACIGLKKRKIADKIIAVAAPCYLPKKKWYPVFGEAIDKKLYDPRTYIKTANKETEFLLIHGKLDFVVSIKDSKSLNNKLNNNHIKSTLLSIRLMDHASIIFMLFIGPLFLTRKKMKDFILRH